jgi:outer membrane receptor protein involved in Fe transport
MAAATGSGAAAPEVGPPAATDRTAAPGGSELQEVVVTGSHIAESTFTTPTPVTVIDSSVIQSMGLVNVGDVINQMPQNSNFTSAANVGLGNFNIGAQFANLRGLDPFFGTRTLTLVNSQRFVPTSAGGAVDLNVVPSILIARTEVVTGGASAAYGSDAVAGVVNVIMDDKLQGFKLQLDGGETTYHDGGDLHAALAFGKAFANGRVHEVFGAEYEDSQTIGFCGAVRPWCAQGYAEFTNTGYLTNGLPHWSVYNHTSLAITDTIEASFDASFAQRRATNVQGSDGPTGFPVNVIYPDNAYLPPAVAAAMGPFPAWFAANTGNQISLINSTTNNVGRLVLGLKGDLPGHWHWDGYYTWGETGTRQRLANDTVQYLGVAPALTRVPNPAGAYDSLNWALNAVVNPATGQIACAASIPGNPFYNPLAAGCQPLDLFGANKASAAALAYAFRTLHEDSAFTQQVVSASANGELFGGWGAGPVSAAFGAEYRHSMANVTHDIGDQPWYDQYLLSYGVDYKGTIDVVEGFTELRVPLLKDLPLAKHLELDASARETRNKNSNGVTDVSSTYNFPAWKFGLVDDVTDWLRLRVARSRDTRAPSFYELWAQTIDVGGLFGTVVNPWKNPPGSPSYGRPTDPARVAAGSYASSIGLSPEAADTTTVGVVLTPEDALQGLRLSADWYQIVIHSAISQVGAAGLINACYAGYAYYCQFLSGTPNGTGGFGTITGVDNYNLNIGSYTTRGYDFELDYSLPLSRLAAGRHDSLDFRVLATYQYDQFISPGQGLPGYNYAGQSGPTAAFGDFNTEPKWQGNAFVTYANDGFTGVLQIRYVGPGRYAIADSNTGLPLIAPGEGGYSAAYPGSINTNSVASATYVNVALNYTLPFWTGTSQSIQVFGTLDNAFNKYPPVAPGGNGYPTNPVYFDTYGRTWRAGVRLQF